MNNPKEYVMADVSNKIPEINEKIISVMGCVENI
jgi:hypothetical protein